jgi:hypothetical protein
VTLVSDEVWRQLDPEAGRLPRRTVLRLRWTISATLALTLLVGLAWQSGLVLPRLRWPNSGPSPNAPQGMREYTGRDPYAVEWQRAVADMSCNPR